jgi:hypothetical protein
MICAAVIVSESSFMICAAVIVSESSFMICGAVICLSEQLYDLCCCYCIRE